MKITSKLVLGGLFLVGQVTTGLAATTFNVSATVPLATSVSIVVDSVNSTSNVFTAEPAGFTALSFDPMSFNSTNNIYLPTIYYALNFSAAGAGEPDLTLTYTEGTNPNGTTNGLGFKTTATFAKEVGTTETIIGAKQRLTDLNAYHVPYTDFTGGYARVYIGVWTGSTTAPADPTNGQPFSNGDAAGAYTGSLAVTAVVN